jgi:predicted glutamine amidotransferase
MCEFIAAAWDRPVPYARLDKWAADLERYGLGSFGWGVAWVSEGEVQVERGLGRYVDEAPWRARLQAVESTRFLVHLRRPSKLSTIAPADTQPFPSAGRYAFCHNGFLKRAEQYRSEYASELQGSADSEVGWRYFDELVAAGWAATDALRSVDERFGGEVNLGYLDADNVLAIYTRSDSNPMWRFSVDGGRVATTALHSSDASVFDFVYPGVGERRFIPPTTALRIDQPWPAEKTGDKK